MKRSIWKVLPEGTSISREAKANGFTRYAVEEDGIYFPEERVFITRSELEAMLGRLRALDEEKTAKGET